MNREKYLDKKQQFLKSLGPQMAKMTDQVVL